MKKLKSQLMLKNERNQQLTRKFKSQLFLQLNHTESNILGTWVNKSNVVEDSHTFFSDNPQ